MKLDTSSLFKKRDSRPITYQEAHDELLSTYDDYMGLDTGYHHVGLSSFENPLHGSLYELWMKAFLREGVGENFKVSFEEWLKKPRWYLLMQLRLLAERRNELARRANELGDNPELGRELADRLSNRK